MEGRGGDGRGGEERRREARGSECRLAGAMPVRTGCPCWCTCCPCSCSTKAPNCNSKSLGSLPRALLMCASPPARLVACRSGLGVGAVGGDAAGAQGPQGAAGAGVQGDRRELQHAGGSASPCFELLFPCGCTAMLTYLWCPGCTSTVTPLQTPSMPAAGERGAHLELEGRQLQQLAPRARGRAVTRQGCSRGSLARRRQTAC